jgi:hypothetical protein
MKKISMLVMLRVLHTELMQRASTPSMLLAGTSRIPMISEVLGERMRCEAGRGKVKLDREEIRDWLVEFWMSVRVGRRES